MILRSELPDQDGHRMGDVKLVWHQRAQASRCSHHGAAILTVIWSPPHIYRGVPLGEFEQFLLKVMESTKDWDGKSSGERNMYDACKHIVLEEAARFDASYAELCT